MEINALFSGSTDPCWWPLQCLRKVKGDHSSNIYFDPAPGEGSKGQISLNLNYKSKEEDKDQELIQSSTTRDPRHHGHITHKRACAKRSVLFRQVITRQQGTDVRL